MYHQRWRFIAVVVAFLVAVSSMAPVLARQAELHGIDPADMDLTVDPGVDFYEFANGGWLDRVEIPGDKGSYGVFAELDDQTTELLLDLLGRLAANDTLQGGTDEWKAVRLFEQGTDMVARNEAGLRPVAPILDEIEAIQDTTGLHAFLQGSIFRGVEGLLPVLVFPDLEESAVNAAYVGGPFLGLPNRDYYLEDAPGNEEVRAAYVATVAELLGMLGYEAGEAAAAAEAVYDLEYQLAEPTLTREESQNISLLYNPMTIETLGERYPLMDWSAYLETLGLTGTDELIVTEAAYLDALDAIVGTTAMATLKDYLKLQVLWAFSDNLNEELAETAFAFQGRVLGGVEEMAPVEERVLDEVNGLLGEAVGQLYVAEAFPPEAKAQIEELVQELILAYGARLEANPWMTPETKELALAKLAELKVKVGYPDEWRSYGGATIEDSYARSALSAYNAEVRRSLNQAGEPVDETEWGIPPQVVNAYYNLLNNEIVFPAAILQPPFFDYQADPASNYGAIGFVIGHEITHGFDLQGSQFDAEGNLVNWWSEEDFERFQALNDEVVAQYAAIEVLPDLFLEGQITVTENVADLGGVQVAYDALQLHLATEGEPLPPPPYLPTIGEREEDVLSLSQKQRFFVAAATVWRAKVRDEALQTQVRAGVHSPASVRATQPIRNMDAFYEAFDIQPGDPMWLAPEERVVIW